MTLASRLSLALLAAALAAPASAAVPIIDTDELKRAIDAKEDLLLVDTLSPIEFAEERIAGSVNLPYTALKSGKAKLPDDKSKRMVFFCKGPKCTKSHKTAKLAVGLGYQNVAVYNEGIPEWLKRGYPAETRKIYPAAAIPTVSASELKALLDREAGVFVLDIRDEDDARAGTIPGARNVDLEMLDARLSEIPMTMKIVLVDLHGRQTQIAGRFLAWKGYRDVVRLDGGFVGGWVRAGLPVAR